MPERGLTREVEDYLRRQGFVVVPEDSLSELVQGSMADAKVHQQLVERVLWAERALRNIGRELEAVAKRRYGKTNYLWRLRRQLPRTLLYLQVLEDRDTLRLEESARRARRRRRHHG